METVKDLIERLNTTDECNTIEAKKGGGIDHSVMETVCAFSNEPGLQGGYILLGIERDEASLFPSYSVTGVTDPDKLQLDLSSQCASMFNIRVRPEIKVEEISGKLAMKVWIPELPQAQKPLYFKSEKLPAGAYRRISSSDQRCTDDDLYVFYNKEDSLDSSMVKGTSYADISEEAIKQYRSFRAKVNEYAEELNYSDEELLQSLGCLQKENEQWVLTYTGLLVFGKRASLRRLLPMVRVDYIRVPGNEWVKDPENRFTTIDMRGSLIELLLRAFNAIADDLPKGFLLPEGELQASAIGLPAKVLREALVNAFIHRTYRENQPIQIIRYGNRIEIHNPGFSLKPEEQLGEPGSKNRNPFIAAIFHETNLAETKGSGIRTMRILMEKAGMVPPTFESDHSANQFTARLLLHHFLSEEDLQWLKNFENLELNDAQKRALIFSREVGAIDNPTYRQLNGTDVIKASVELRTLREAGLLEQKGKGRATYYMAAPKLVATVLTNLSSAATPKESLSTPVTAPVSTPVSAPLKEQLERLGKRIHNPADLERIIVEICKERAYKLQELAELINRQPKYILKKFIQPMLQKGALEYTEPDMPNHPNQAYRTKKAKP